MHSEEGPPGEAVSCLLLPEGLKKEEEKAAKPFPECALLLVCLSRVK